VDNNKLGWEFVRDNMSDKDKETIREIHNTCTEESIDEVIVKAAELSIDILDECTDPIVDELYDAFIEELDMDYIVSRLLATIL